MAGANYTYISVMNDDIVPTARNTVIKAIVKDIVPETSSKPDIESNTEYSACGQTHGEAIANFEGQRALFTTDLTGFEKQLEDIVDGDLQTALREQVDTQLDVYIEDENLKTQMKKHFSEIGLGSYWDNREKIRSIIGNVIMDRQIKKLLSDVKTHSLSTFDFERLLWAMKEKTANDLHNMFSEPKFETYEELCTLVGKAKSDYEAVCRIKNPGKIISSFKEATRKKYDSLEKCRQAWQETLQMPESKELLKKAERGLEIGFIHNLHLAKLEQDTLTNLDVLLGKIDAEEGQIIYLEDLLDSVENAVPKKFKKLLSEAGVDIRNYNSVRDYLEQMRAEYVQLCNSEVKDRKELELVKELYAAANVCKRIWDFEKNNESANSSFGALKEIYYKYGIKPGYDKLLDDVISMFENKRKDYSEAYRILENSDEEAKKKLNVDKFYRGKILYTRAINYVKTLKNIRELEFPYEDVNDFVRTNKWLTSANENSAYRLKNIYHTAREKFAEGNSGNPEWLILTDYGLYMGNRKGFIAANFRGEKDSVELVINSYNTPDKNIQKLLKTAGGD